MLSNELFEIAPAELVEARGLCHAGAQWGSKAARASLLAEADDSHSNLGWDNARFGLLSRYLDADRQLQLGFSFLTRSLIWIVDERIDSSFDLATGSEASAQAWVDDRLSRVGLQTTRAVEMPYELPEADYLALAGLERQVGTLGHWFACAHTVINDLVDRFGAKAVTRPDVRCWPHHFDLAALFALEEGDPETARSIGVGLSPGDETCAEPYFYCSPWPAPDRKTLTTPPSPWRWHTEGFVALICPASSLSASDDLLMILSHAVQLAGLDRGG